MWFGFGIYIVKYDIFNFYVNRDWKWEKLNSREYIGSKEESNIEWLYIFSFLVRYIWKYKRTIKYFIVYYDLEIFFIYLLWLNYENIIFFYFLKLVIYLIV